MPSTSTVSIQAAKAHFDDLIDRIGDGDEFVITIDDKPVAKLSPISVERKPLPYGLLKGKLIPNVNFD